MTVLDTNIVISLTNPAHEFHIWSELRFTEQKASGPLILPRIAYAELSVAYLSCDEVNLVLDAFGLEQQAENDEVLFKAGKAFKRYKDKNAGPKLNVLPHFIIGAFAEVYELPLLSLELDRYPNYFPSVRVISPKTCP